MVAKMPKRGSYANRLMSCFAPNPQFVLDSCLTDQGNNSFASEVSFSGADTFTSDGEIQCVYPNFNTNGDMKLLPLFIGGQNLLFRNGIREVYQTPSNELKSGFSPDQLDSIKNYLANSLHSISNTRK